MAWFLSCFVSSKNGRKKSKKHAIADPVQAVVNNCANLGSQDVYGHEYLSTNQERKVVFDNKTSSKVSCSEFKYEHPVTSAQTVPVTSSLGSSHSLNHRYVNCLDDDYEIEDLNYRTSFRENEEDDLKKECKNVESVEKETDSSSMEIGSNRRDYVQPVLNSEKDLSETKAAEAEEMPPLLNLEKEDCKMDQNPAWKCNGMKVDASLSNWLPASEITAKKSNSGRNWEEERPILGALTLDELKKLSPSSTPRKSPSRSPDEIPIIGTVGTYWNIADSSMEFGSPPSSLKGIPNTTSKYREDKKVNWRSTPFETRLERALNRDAA